MNRDYDVLVIGAGQAGLAAGYYLSRQNGLSCVLLNSLDQAGDTWRKRYDSLVLFTPRSMNGLPGLPFPGDPDGVPDKNEVADYLDTYARHFSLPIHANTTVQRLAKTETGFIAYTTAGEYHAKKVVIATGPFSTPAIPAWAGQIDEAVTQLHTSEYLNPRQLQPGPVLVVGAGNSGAQIAIEVAQTHPVILSAGQPRRYLPQYLWGRNIFWYLQKIGFLSVTIEHRIGKWLSRQPDPIFGYGEELRRLSQSGDVVEKGRAVSTSADGKRVSFADGTNEEVANIIWATGFRRDYAWVDLPGLLGEDGRLLHHRGVSAVEGLYFVGLPWQYRRGSALLGGVGRDAEYVVACLGT
ncbi:flavin-containing monooxygenase [Brevibacillus dissolubilis]|uniref:flavin-containing monooxygenase n=1 Tax=Brevibacillus dissolubilis TaxID=1844116 RepID=UPI001116869B|nr:NAD(P)-binding domain-containing protein [Brevibacillus dissolubilis]